MMKQGGTGGAHTITGLKFEQKTDLLTLLSQIDGYSVEPDPRGQVSACCFRDDWSRGASRNTGSTISCARRMSTGSRESRAGFCRTMPYS